MDNRITVIDYTGRENSLYINLEVFDANHNKLYKEEVRFLDDLLYGDLVHEGRSPLSDTCREEVVGYLKKYFNR
ncbi:hypothetical protein [Metaplanococcus flavidus]|uniref:Uncharacterized protein n=1 Tax=Metaplanococcus flavidus TaxID=569883 RepID=A0ABW3LEG8_9BACL